MDSHRKIRKRRVRMEVFRRDGYTCQLCGWQPKIPYAWDGTTPLTDGYRTLTIDHIIERSLGGPSIRENFRAACDRCNIKRSVHVGKLVREGQMRGLNIQEARQWAARRLGLILPN